VFFALYPAVWYVGIPGPLNLLNAFETSVAFVILPFFCKQVYGFLDMYLIHRADVEM
jgi:bacteriorhodopsin